MEQYQDAELLDRLYNDEGLSGPAIAEQLGCSTYTVYKYLNLYDLKDTQQGAWLLNPAPIFDHNEYKAWKDQYRGERVHVYVHQLLAVANGADPHQIFGGDLEVHHKNNRRWDNRPENLMCLTKSEHAQLHANERLRKREAEMLNRQPGQIQESLAGFM